MLKKFQGKLETLTDSEMRAIEMKNGRKHKKNHALKHHIFKY